MNNLFDNNFFAGNRKAILRELGSGALVVLTANTTMQRNADIAFKFEQEANFWYVTGIELPDWQVIIDGTNKTWLVMPESDEVRDVFDGNLSRAEATEISGIKDILDPIEAKRLLGRLRQEHPLVYTLTPQSYPHFGFHPNPAQRQLVESLSTFRVQDCRQELHRLRAIKQPNEIKTIQKAVDITVVGITRALSGLKRLQYEYEVEAEITYQFRRLGARGDAYDAIVSSGKNACIMHNYLDRDTVLGKNDWLLFDVGAKVSQYCADITRTIPLGKTTKRENALYEATLRVHDKAIKMCRPGQSVREYHEEMNQAMLKELYDLKLIKDDDELHQFFPHAISHGLGIDVHDPLGRPTHFAEGMVLTVEPGIYVPQENIGIRIENDIHITADGPVNMSKKLPTDLGKLETLIKGA